MTYNISWPLYFTPDKPSASGHMVCTIIETLCMGIRKGHMYGAIHQIHSQLLSECHAVVIQQHRMVCFYFYFVDVDKMFWHMLRCSATKPVFVIQETPSDGGLVVHCDAKAWGQSPHCWPFVKTTIGHKWSLQRIGMQRFGLLFVLIYTDCWANLHNAS